MTTRRQFLLYVATALAAVGVFAGDVAQAGKPPALKLTVTVSPSTIIEGSTATGKVTHNNSSLSSPVTVTLSSSDTGEATVAATVTIPAGTNTVNFAVTAINDNTADGSQPVTITAAATGYASGSTNVTVDDQPTFQYVLTIPQMPMNYTSYIEINDINNRGQVVGHYTSGDHWNGFLYDPGLGVIDLSALDLPGLPPGYQINSVVGINEHQVMVGYLTHTSGNRIGYAIDWAAVNPVVDLLPNLDSVYSYGVKINENGDILGVFGADNSSTQAYFYNPGVYGDPEFRVPRDGSPLDWSSEVPDDLPPFGIVLRVALNNPGIDSPAQIAGINQDGVPFRYTTGPFPLYELFPQINPITQLFEINDSGTFCGQAGMTTSVKGRTTRSYVPFRFSSTIQYLDQGTGQYQGPAYDINNAGDVVKPTSSGASSGVYRDGRGWRQLTDLPVIGTTDDMLLWFNSSPTAKSLSDRVTSDDTGCITGNISGKFFVLTPVPAP